MARAKTKASARRAAPRSAAKRTAAPGSGARVRRRAARPLQRFVVSHHREEDFQGGLRTYVVPPCRPEEVSKRHYHDVEFQMIYVLKGWISPVN